jgi:predicted transcriptional regulator of viral defense system
MDPHDFFATHAVFSTQEFIEATVGGGSVKSSSVAHRLLTYHTQEGRIVRVKRGLYASVPPGRSPDGFEPDRFLLGSRSCPGAVISHHSALEMHGVAYSLYPSEVQLTLLYLVRDNFRWRGVLYRTTKVPLPLSETGQEAWGVREMDVRGVGVPVTGIERTLVDTIRRPKLGGGWEEIDRSVASVRYLRMDLVLEYVRMLGSPVLASRIGFLLERHAEDIGVSDSDLDSLAALGPESKVYLSGGRRESGRLHKRWNLIVPENITEDEWEGAR